MTNLTKTTCALFGCNNIVQNWRSKCCCPTHQRQHAAKVRYGTENLPNKTKEEIDLYYRQYATEKQKRVKNATPKWANKEKIKEVYLEAITLTNSTGIPHEVDHIVPLTNKLVCGLHNEFNLRVVSRNENRTKWNKFVVE